MAIIRAPRLAPNNITRAAETALAAIDNDQEARADPIRQAELMCQHLAAARKMSIGGVCGPRSVVQAVRRWWFRCALTPYTKYARVKGYASTANQTDIMTIKAITDTVPAGITTLIYGSAENTRIEAVYWELVIQVGNGDRNDLGTELVEVEANMDVVTSGNIWYIGVQPLPAVPPFQDTIEVL